MRPLRCAAPAGDVALRAAPTHAAISAAAAVLAQCDAVATLAPLTAGGRTLEVLGRLSLEQRLAVRAGGAAAAADDDGGGWVAPPPRSCLYRIAEATCQIVAAGPIERG